MITPIFTPNQRNLLRDKLTQLFDFDELREFYFEHGGDDELVIPEGSTKGRAVQKMVEHHERRGELCHLLAWACKERSIVDWSGLPIAECVGQANKIATDNAHDSINPNLPLPFICGTSVPPTQFYGRHAEKRDVKMRLGGVVPQCINLIGLRRSGKSSLLRYIQERISEFCPNHYRPIVVSLDFQEAQYQTPQGVLEGLRRGITKTTGQTPWAKTDNDDAWAVKEGLEQLQSEGRRLIILIDEFERLAKYLKAFDGWGPDWRAKASAGLFGLCIASSRPLHTIYKTCGLDSPFDNLFTNTYLGALANDDWRQLLHNSFEALAMPLLPSAMDWIDDMAGGLPFYVQMAATYYVTQTNPTSRHLAFTQQTRPHFAALWQHLHNYEQQAVRHFVAPARYPAPMPALLNTLQLFGLLKANSERLFSQAFADFVAEQ